MASQALYRKWRSQTFNELVGQEHVVQTLQHAIQAGRIGHAYLFTGPRGVGKTTMARLLAKAVNCEAPLDQRPCDQCEMCRSIAEGRAVDVIEMDAASQTGVENARENIIDKINFRPAEARFKVYVIDEVHMLSISTFNALLKTLEEPPGHALFILATTEFQRVPATVVSRCQRFVFTRHSINNIVDHLERIAQGEGIVLEEGVAERIARAATGAMRDAISILDQLIAGSDDTITLAQVQGLLGATDTSKVGALVSALTASDVQRALQIVNEAADDGADLRQFARDLVDRLRGLLLLSASNDASTLDVPAETLAEMQDQVAQTSVGQLVAWLKLFSNLDYQLKNSPYGQLPLELAVVEALVAPTPVATTAPAHVAPQPAARAATPKPVAPQRYAPPAPAAQPPQAEVTPVPEPRDAIAPPDPTPADDLLPPVEQPVPAAIEAAVDRKHQPSDDVIEVVDDAAFLLEDVEKCWEQVVLDILAEDKMLFAQLERVVPINVEETTIVLLAQRGDWQKKMLESKKSLRILERHLSHALGEQCFIRVTSKKEEEMPDVKKQIQHIRKDELVRSAINVFDATIIAIEQP